jgi:L-aminopeptidase/D-esterase-like protein
MKYLEEKGIGFPFGAAHVPTVPGASLFDLPVGDPKIRPTADCGYRAAKAATDAAVTEGSVGAGAGATIGKLGGFNRAMKAGIGSASIRMPDGLIVAALVAVNAVGDVIDPSTGQVVAGVRTEDGKGFADARALLRSGGPRRTGGAGENTTLGVIATNATLTKTQATRVAQMAHDGFARAISPSHTPNDGDVIFALATGATGAGDVGRIGELGAEMMADAIVRAVREATGVPGYPALRDLRR